MISDMQEREVQNVLRLELAARLIAECKPTRATLRPGLQAAERQVDELLQRARAAVDRWTGRAE